MGVRIWIDDLRSPPDDSYDFHVKWYSEFHSLIKNLKLLDQEVSHVSFDYVLNDDPKWPRPYEKHGDACVELFAAFHSIHSSDLTVEFHSSDELFNQKMRIAWESAMSYHNS